MIRALGQDVGPATLGAHHCHSTNNVFRDRLCHSTRYQPTTDNRPQSGYRTIWNTTRFSLFSPLPCHNSWRHWVLRLLLTLPISAAFCHSKRGAPTLACF